MKHYIIVFSPKESTHRFAWHSFLKEKDTIIRIKNYLNEFEIKYGVLDLAYHMIQTDDEKITSVRAKSSFFRDVFFLEEDDFKQKIMYDYQFTDSEHFKVKHRSFDKESIALYSEIIEQLLVRSRNLDKESFTICSKSIEQLIDESSIISDIFNKTYCEYMKNKKMEFKVTKKGNIEKDNNVDVEKFLVKSKNIKNGDMLLSL